MKESFWKRGFEYRPGALTGRDLELMNALASDVLDGRPGVRVRDHPLLRELLATGASLIEIVKAKLGERAHPVRAVFFDKTAAANWALGWHQDRTIVVKERAEVPGYEIWTMKDGLVHVEPPFEIIAKMVTLRAHLDPCDEKNAPLAVVPGSHRLGRLRSNETAKLADRLGSETCLAEAGDVWVYATAIVHASDPADEPRRRRVLQVDFVAEDLPGGLEWLGV